MPPRDRDDHEPLELVKQREICAIVGVGCPLLVAAKYVGLAVGTIRQALERDSAFKSALAQAESRAEVTNLSRIQQAASESRHWRAAAWTLERKFPHRYGARRKESLTLEQVVLVLSRFTELLADQATVEQRRVLVERLEQLISELSGAAGAGEAAP